MRCINILLLGIALTAAGCGSGQTQASGGQVAGGSIDPVVGVWKATSGNATLDMKADHTFSLSVSKPITGTWKQSGSVYDLAATVSTKSTPSFNPSSQAPTLDASAPPINASLSTDKQTLTLTGDPGHPFDARAVTIDFRK